MPNIDDILRYESGVLDDEEVIEFFAGLIKSGVVWQLQGSYGRTASELIRLGLISEDGNITGSEIYA